MSKIFQRGKTFITSLFQADWNSKVSIQNHFSEGDAQWDKVKPYSVQKKLERNKIHPFKKYSKIWSVTLENYKNILWCNVL